MFGQGADMLPEQEGVNKCKDKKRSFLSGLRFQIFHLTTGWGERLSSNL